MKQLLSDNYELSDVQLDRVISPCVYELSDLFDDCVRINERLIDALGEYISDGKANGF